ncbi:MAG: winged helix DNA-binding domain-containing protein, partial [Polyangiaceae bacterium]
MLRSEVGKLRLISQKIASSDSKSAVDVVRWMTAVQAQDFSAAKWAIGSRCPGSVHHDVELALATGKIVRSWPMRGTLHFLAAEDLHWILSLTSTRIVNAAKTRHDAAGLTKTVIERARKATLRALEGGGCLTRAEMHDVFRRAKIDPEKDRGYMLLWILAQAGVLCFGPVSGTSQTFVLAGEWIKKRRERERDEALGELALRYFRSHGPATLRDFSTWSSLTLADAKIGLAVARSLLAEIEIDEIAYFLGPNVRDASLEKTDQIYALAAFEEFLLGYRDRDAVMASDRMKAIVPGA